jgi:hypothetical protein
MQDALVFGGQNSLDFLEIRLGVLRIPEVSVKLEEAQKIWDAHCRTSFSFVHFLASEDRTFFNNINLKSLSLAVVQLGLLTRFNRLFRAPKYLVGNTQNDSSLMVAAGKMKLEELILNSQACHMVRPMAPIQALPSALPDTMLKGRTLAQYQAYEAQPSGEGMVYNPVGTSDMNMESVLFRLVEGHDIKKIIHIGPGAMDANLISEDYRVRDVQIFESIDIDPMLGWFWQGLRKHDTAAVI